MGRVFFDFFHAWQVVREKEECVFAHVLVPRLGEDVGVLPYHFLPNSLKTGPLSETGVCPFPLDWLVLSSSLLGL